MDIFEIIFDLYLRYKKKWDFSIKEFKNFYDFRL